MILALKDIFLEYNNKIILDHIDFNIADNDKIGLIGINGTGKSSLLKLIASFQDLDNNHLQAKKNLVISYLDQDSNTFNQQDLVKYVCDNSNDPSLIAQAKKILNQLGLTNHDIKADDLSGGQKKRLALAKTLTIPCDLLLLDEPTNHLDAKMILWLEDYLKKINKAILMITHDRYFLEEIANKIVELESGHIYEYEGNYQAFLEAKANRLVDDKAKVRKQIALLKKEKEWMMQGPKARSTKSKDRIERYEKLKEETVSVNEETLSMESMQSRLGKKILEIKDLSVGFNNHILVEHLTYTFKSNDRIGILGSNGAGKSTLLNTLTQSIPPLSGTLDYGSTVKIGYFSQQSDDLNQSQRVIDYIRDKAEFIQTSDGLISASAMLEKFLFNSQAQYQLISKLSGGEKRRLLLLGVLMMAPNFLILDEPTNDLDVETLTILEDYLQSFKGVIIIVSHDRYFVDKIVDYLWIIQNKEIVFTNEKYSLYLDSLNEEVKVKDSSPVEKKSDYRNKKLKLTFAESKELETIDDEIASLEEKIESLTQEMSMYGNDFDKLQAIGLELEQTQLLLEEKSNRWLELNEKVELINNQ